MHSITHGEFPGPAGRLEYILTVPDPAGRPVQPPRRAAVVCHPHPLYGGTMHTRIVFHLGRALAEMGMPVLRFQFRGVGRSTGAHDAGRGERDDLAAAIAFLRRRFPLPLVLGGFSFGAGVAVETLARGAWPEIERAVIAGLAVDRGNFPTAWTWRGPKLLLWGERDEFASPAARDGCFERLPGPKRRRIIAGGDHFMAGHMDEFRRAVREELDFDQGTSPATAS